MARIKLELPEEFPFSTELEVTIGDINYGGHLGNDSLMTLLHEARIRFLERYGYSETDVEGRGIIMADAAVVYKSECFRGDRLKIDVTAADPGRFGCDICYRVTRIGDGKEVARAKTGIVFFDYRERKPRELPEEFLTSIFLS